MNQKCVWVREVGVLAVATDRIARWEIWSAHNTKSEALDALRRSLKERPKWVTAKFHKATNRIVKYVPERAA